MLPCLRLIFFMADAPPMDASAVTAGLNPYTSPGTDAVRGTLYGMDAYPVSSPTYSLLLQQIYEPDHGWRRWSIADGSYDFSSRTTTKCTNSKYSFSLGVGFLASAAMAVGIAAFGNLRRN